jgi:hypothetical protein
VPRHKTKPQPTELLDDAPDDLEDEDELVGYFADQLDIDDDELADLVDEATETADIVAALALLDLFAAGYNALDDAAADAAAAVDKHEGPDLTERLNDIAADMSDDLGERLDIGWGDADGSEIDSLASINAQSEYSESKSDADIENGFEYSRYLAEGDACDVCKDCHGTVLPSDDPWWDDHEPDNNHPGCRCIKDPCTKTEAMRYGISEKAPDVPVSGWKNQWPPDVTNRPDVLAGIYHGKVAIPQTAHWLDVRGRARRDFRS